jgi:tetratricopeptide (TPR) repeat protein
MPPMRAALAQALAADPEFADAHQLAAAVAYNLDYDWETAGKEYARTLALIPDSAAAHASYANYLSAIGQFERALEEAQRAQTLQPSANAEATMGRVLYSGRRYDAAAQHFAQSLKLQDNLAIRFYLGLALLAAGKSAPALQELKATTAERNGGAYAGLAYAYAHLGERDKARKLLDDLFAAQDPGMVVAYRIAAVYMALGDHERAIQWLNRSYDRHENWLAQLKVDPVMDPLRADAGFKALLARLHFPPS